MSSQQQSNPAADQNPTAPVDIGAVRRDALADAATIVSTCQLAGFPELAAGFIREEKPLSQVVSALAAKKAEASAATDVRTGAMPADDSGASKFSFAAFAKAQQTKGGSR